MLSAYGLREDGRASTPLLLGPLKSVYTSVSLALSVVVTIFLSGAEKSSTL